MKHHEAGRPIGKCKGCLLNMRTSCAAGLDPKTQWQSGRCWAANDLSLLDSFLNPQPPTGAKAAKLARIQRRSGTRTRTRLNGFVPPSRHDVPLSAVS